MIAFKTKRKITKELIAVALVTVFGSVFLATTSVAAAPKAGDALNKAAEKVCNKGSDDEKAACRNGYRNGYTGAKNVEEVCGKSRDKEYGTEKETKACKSAYNKGQDDKKKDGGASGPVDLSPEYGDPGGEGKVCGREDPVKTRFDFGCMGPAGPAGMGPIEDLLYAFMRFMSTGVGIVLVVSIVIAGIRYSTSEGNPEQTQAAKNRIRAAMIGLLVYIFAFSFIQYLVPGGMFNSATIVSTQPTYIMRGNL